MVRKTCTERFLHPRNFCAYRRRIRGKSWVCRAGTPPAEVERGKQGCGVVALSFNTTISLLGDITMKKIDQMLALAGIGVLLMLGTGNLAAQQRPGRGNLDPEQFRQRMTERYREQLGVKSDDEWKVIQTRVEKD